MIGVDNFPREVYPLVVEEHPSTAEPQCRQNLDLRLREKSEAQRRCISTTVGGGWGWVIQPAASLFPCQAGGGKLFCSLTRVGPR